MAKFASGKIVANDVFEAEHPFGTDLEGCFIYICDGDLQWRVSVLYVVHHVMSKIRSLRTLGSRTRFSIAPKLARS